MSALVATQVTAIATAALALFAVVTAVFAFLAYRKQSAEVGILGQQAKDGAEVLELQVRELRESLDERRRDSAERRRTQASLMFIWTENFDRGDLNGSRAEAYSKALQKSGAEVGAAVAAAHVRNTSAQPVYDLVVGWNLESVLMGGNQRMLPLMPGEEHFDAEPVPAGASPGAYDAVAFFRDASGVRWRAQPDGVYEEVRPGP
jgi:hypothetical protein